MDKMREAFEAWLGYCEQLDRHTIESMWSAWKAATAQCVPEGYVVVPKEPTQEMCQQGQWKAKEWPKFPLRIVPIYRAMLEAAPKPGEQA